jgi:endonuclease/exonuclease/phosphatase family metal-dependent hydrolase
MNRILSHASLVSWAFLFCAAAAAPAEPSKGPAKGTFKDRGDEIVRGLPIEQAPAGGGPAEFVVASYNVQCRPFLDDAAEKLPKISPLLSPFDLVLIQECFVRHDLLWGQADFPNKVYFGRRGKPARVTSSGLSVLTKLPMGEVVGEHYRDVGELQNQLASKGILLVRLQIAGVAVDVYDTHMEAGSAAKSNAVQKGQARQVVEFITRHSPADHAVLLMGDFNMGPARPEKTWEQISPRHYYSPEDMKGRTEAFEIMRKGLKLRDAADEVYGPKDDGIDRLMFRTGTRCQIQPLSCAFAGSRFRRADGSPLSDGAPLIARIRLTPIQDKK